MWNLQGLNILIVEDEFLLADDLASYVAEAGANVLGPSPSLGHAANYLSRADAAVLDVNLNGCPVFPLADDLIKLGVPFVFFTGSDDFELPSRFIHLNFLRKPASRQKLIGAMLGRDLLETDAKGQQRRQVGRQGNARTMPRHEASVAEIMLLLPRLRLAARVMTGGEETGDHLVAQTLERAIAEAAGKPWEVPLLDWLNRIMDECLGSRLHMGGDACGRQSH